MSDKVTRQQLHVALEEFAEKLGLDYSPYSQTMHGKVHSGLLPDNGTDSLRAEVTEETKTVRARGGSLTDYFLGYRRFDETKEATLLGKVNAIADYLGIDFEVTPEHVTAEKVRVVKKAKNTQKSAVKATKKPRK